MRKYTEEQWIAWRRQGAADKAYNLAVTAAARAAAVAARAADEAAQDALSEAEYRVFADARNAWANVTGARGSRRNNYTVAMWRSEARNG